MTLRNLLKEMAAEVTSPNGAFQIVKKAMGDPNLEKEQVAEIKLIANKYRNELGINDPKTADIETTGTPHVYKVTTEGPNLRMFNVRVAGNTITEVGVVPNQVQKQANIVNAKPGVPINQRSGRLGQTVRMQNVAKNIQGQQMVR